MHRQTTTSTTLTISLREDHDNEDPTISTASLSLVYQGPLSLKIQFGMSPVHDGWLFPYTLNPETLNP